MVMAGSVVVEITALKEEASTMTRKNDKEERRYLNMELLAEQKKDALRAVA